MKILDKVNSPDDLKNLSSVEIKLLCDEIRREIITAVSKNGGHLASNLGIVEATVALHRAFDSPKDKIIFDVGHQSYAHKILTGRKERFSSLRTLDGISGFTKRSESPHDPIGAGHSGTSLSAALGLAEANLLRGDNSFVVAVIGDGSFTNGMIFEALNNCAKKKLRLIIILNDNEMSISKNVGALHSYFSDLRTSEKYFSLKHRVQSVCLKVPVVGRGLVDATRETKNAFKRLLVNGNLFEDMGIDYIGPVDGNDIKRLETVLKEAKRNGGSSIIHICTVKGKGYAPAEKSPDLYHAVTPFDPVNGAFKKKCGNFSSAFGKAILSLAAKNEKICTVSAAMADGTGLRVFSEQYPDRFFDVGIAEEHAVTFCAGLSAGGFVPVFAVYSTFLQRCYDQILHDLAIQALPAVLAVDRAGLVCGDGITHQGIYDAAFLSTIPGIEIFSPDSFVELADNLAYAVESGKLVALRYPKGNEKEYCRDAFTKKSGLYYADFGTPDTVLITYGRLTVNVTNAAVSAMNCRVIRLGKIFPLDAETLISLCDGIDRVIIAEEGVRSGGIAEKIALTLKRGEILAIENADIPSGNLDELYDFCSLSEKHIFEKIQENR